MGNERGKPRDKVERDNQARRNLLVFMEFHAFGLLLIRGTRRRNWPYRTAVARATIAWFLNVTTRFRISCLVPSSNEYQLFSKNFVICMQTPFRNYKYVYEGSSCWVSLILKRWRWGKWAINGLKISLEFHVTSYQLLNQCMPNFVSHFKFCLMGVNIVWKSGSKFISAMTAHR